MTHRFTVTAIFICSALLIWAADFLILYVFAAAACARRFSDIQVAGVGIVAFVGIATSVLALTATAVVLWLSRRRMQLASHDDASEQFINRLTYALGLLAIVAILWIALPPLLLHANCGST